MCEHLHLAREPRWQSATARQNDAALCRRMAGPVDAHHVVPKARIKQAFPHGGEITWLETEKGHAILEPRTPGEESAVWLELGELLMDERNGIPVRRYHHDALEQRAVSFAVGAWPEGVRDFAAEHGFVWDDRKGFVHAGARAVLELAGDGERFGFGVCVRGTCVEPCGPEGGCVAGARCRRSEP